MGFLKIKKKFIIKTIFILLLSVLPIAWIVQENSEVQKKIVGKLIDILEKEWSARISVKSYSINFFTGNIYLKNGKIKFLKKSHKKFGWYFDEANIAFSRLDYLFKDFFLMDVVFKKVRAKILVDDDQLDVKEHFKKIVLEESNIGGRLRYIGIKDFLLKINYFDNYILIKLFGSLGLKKFGNSLTGEYWSGSLFLNDGNILLNNNIIFNNIKICSFFSENKFFPNMFNKSINGSFSLFGQNYLIKVSKKIIKIHNEDLSFDLNFDLNSFNNFKLSGCITLGLVRYLYNSFQNKCISKNILNGNCKFDFKIKKKDILGRFIFSDLDIPLLKESRWISKINYSDFKNTGKLCLRNLDRINLFDSWFIKPNEFDFTLDMDSKLNFSGGYEIIGRNTLENKRFICKANYFFNKDFLKTYGFINCNYFGIDLLFKPYFHIKKFLYTKGKQKLINFFLKPGNKNILVGNIDFSLFRLFLPYSLKRCILGKKTKFCLYIDQGNSDYISGQVFLMGNKLSIFKGYNPIEGFRFNFLFSKLSDSLVINNFVVNFFKGNIISNEIKLKISNLGIQSFILPLKINDIFVNWGKNFYGLLSGDLLIEQKNEKITDIKGNIVFKKSLFKTDFFNFNNDNNFTNFSHFIYPFNLGENVINFDITFKNFLPIKLKTSFANLDLNSDINLIFTLNDGRFLNPKINGNLFLERGFLDFMQHKLFVDYGKIQFLPNRLNDPIVDFVAKNKVKKYLINLHITGPLSNPKIMLESFPKLNKKQILALLISGSPNVNFKTHFSEILQRNLGNFNSRNSLLSKLVQPFKFIQITPNFVNQMGKSGLKGSIDIDMNEQFHAKIQKNFNLHDDLFFQFDYFVTDDINLQFHKDQRGELGAQVEVRLIF